MKKILSYIYVTLLILVITIFITYPGIFTLHNEQIIGDVYDPIVNCCIMQDNLDYLFGNRSGNFWNMPIYYPFTHSKTFSEMLLTETVIFGLARMAGAGIIQSHNLVFLFMTFVGLMGAFVIARHFKMSMGISLFAAVFYINCNYWHDHDCHLNIITGMSLLPWYLLALIRYGEIPSLGRLTVLLGSLLLLNFGMGYYTIYGTILLCVVIIYRVFISWNRNNIMVAIKHLMISLFVIAIVEGPFLYAYDRIHQENHFFRRMKEVIYYSADLVNFFQPNIMNRILYPIMSSLTGYKAEGSLCVGPVIYGLCIYGLIHYVRQNRLAARLTDSGHKVQIILVSAMLLLPVAAGYFITGYEEQLAYVFFLLFIYLALILYRSMGSGERTDDPGKISRGILTIAVIISFFICVGPVIHINGHEVFRSVYYLFYKYFYGGKSFRVPTRLFPVIQLAAALLAAWSASLIIRSLKRPFLRYGVILILIVLWNCCNFYLPLRTAAVITHPKSNEFLKKLEGDAIAVFPLTLRVGEAKRMSDALFHGKRLVNGFSGGYIPAENVNLVLSSKSGLTPEYIDRLRDLGIRYVVIQTDEEQWAAEYFSARFNKLLITAAYFPEEHQAIMEIPAETDGTGMTEQEMVAVPSGKQELKDDNTPEKNNPDTQDIPAILPTYLHMIEAEQLMCDVGKNVDDPDAANGIARFADPALDHGTRLVQGPFLDYPPGHYRAVFRLKTDDNSRDSIVAEAHISSNCHSIILDQYDIAGKNFNFPGRYQDFELYFDVIDEKGIGFNVTFPGVQKLWVDFISITRMSPDHLEKQREITEFDLFEAEDLPCKAGKNIQDSTASGGSARFADPDNDSRGALTYGPGFNYSRGMYQATFRIKTTGIHDQRIIADIHVSANYHHSVLAEKDLRGTDFISPGDYQDFRLNFEVFREKYIEFHVTFVGRQKLWVDNVKVIKISPVL